MPMYLSKFSYTPETWARMIQNPEDRQHAAQAYIESVGGSSTASGTGSERTTATPSGKLPTTSRWPPSLSLSAEEVR